MVSYLDLPLELPLQIGEGDGREAYKEKENTMIGVKEELIELIASLPEVVNAVPCKAGERRRGRTCSTPEELAERIVEGCLGITPPCDEEGLRYRDDDFIPMAGFLREEARELVWDFRESRIKSEAEYIASFAGNPNWEKVRRGIPGPEAAKISGGRGGTGRGFLGG